MMMTLFFDITILKDAYMGEPLSRSFSLSFSAIKLFLLTHLKTLSCQNNLSNVHDYWSHFLQEGDEASTEVHTLQLF